MQYQLVRGASRESTNILEVRPTNFALLSSTYVPHQLSCTFNCLHMKIQIHSLFSCWDITCMHALQRVGPTLLQMEDNAGASAQEAEHDAR